MASSHSRVRVSDQVQRKSALGRFPAAHGDEFIAAEGTVLVGVKRAPALCGGFRIGLVGHELVAAQLAVVVHSRKPCRLRRAG